MTRTFDLCCCITGLIAGPTHSSGCITEPPIFPNRQLYLAQYRRVDVDRACPPKHQPLGVLI